MSLVDTRQTTPVRAVAFAAVCVVLCLYAMQISAVAVAVPQMVDDLGSSLRWVGWVVTIYTLALAIAMPVAGKLSDDFGRREVLAAGLGLFALASLVCALAPTVYILIGARAAQGLAAGSLMPSAFGIVGDLFLENRSQAIGFLSSVPAMGAVIGPNMGGLFVDYLDWRWIFLVNVPLALAVLLLLLTVVRQERTTRPQSIDFLGVALLGVSLAAFLYALTELGQRDSSANTVILVGSLSVALIAGASFLRHELRTAAPAVDLKAVFGSRFIFINLLNFSYGATSFGASTFIPIYAQEAFGLSATESGVVLGGRALAIVAGALLASVLLLRTGYRRPIVVGMLIFSAALVAMSFGVNDPRFAGIAISTVAYMAILSAIMGFGHGITGPASNNAAIEIAPDRVASLAGLRGMFRFLGGGIGIAVVLTYVSRSGNVGDAMEVAFAGLALATMLSTLLVLQIRDPLRRSTTQSPSGAAQ